MQSPIQAGILKKKVWYFFLKKNRWNNRKDMLKKKENNNGAENRKGATIQPEIEIPGRQKADGIKQVEKLDQKKHHSQTE